MPEMDGYEATRVIRTSESIPSRNLPILAMTANAMARDADKCIGVAMNDYISNPIAAKRLAEILLRWLDPEAITRKPAA